MSTHQHDAQREKDAAALSSVIAAVGLTGMKLAVGLATNSLGILSEAAHSGLDLVAAGITWFAVRHSAAPADDRHPYGHGKIETLSALVETLLLLVTCLWIVFEAVDRLTRHPEPVDVTWWSAGVIVVSIIVDVSRSRMLKRVADKHNSQALEADALHFSTDVWSSCVVLLGLGCVWLARLAPEGSLPRAVLERADAVAALGVCAIVVWVSVRMGRKAVDHLLDGGTESLARDVRAALENLPGVRGVGQVRARVSGPSAFVDLHLDVARQASFEEAHRVAARAQDLVRAIAPGADVVVHTRPVAAEEADIFELVRGVGASMGLPVHGLRAHRTPQGLHLEMHVEVADTLSLHAAHEMVTALEQVVAAQMEEPVRFASHIEPVGAPDPEPRPEADASPDIRLLVERLIAGTDGVSDCHGVAVHKEGGEYSVSFHCRMAPSVSIGDAHEMTTRLEKMVRAAVEHVGRVVIHVEPEPGPEPGYPSSAP